ncbi:MAG TPA: hypothetical protein VN823_17035 [Stellaceae bacterium]|nr:hypothetical protein [Stellaceae bacterium]
MVLRTLLVASVFGMGAVYWLSQQGMSSACFDEVTRLDEAYKKFRPAGGSHAQIENGIAQARKYCAAGKQEEATRLLNTSGMLCRLNNGCAKS